MQKKIKAFIAGGDKKDIVFIGAGCISMEIALLLAETAPNALDIPTIGLMFQPLPLMLNKNMADPVRRAYLEKKDCILRQAKMY